MGIIKLKAKQAVKEIYHLFSRFIPDRHFPVSFPGGKIYLDFRESHRMLSRVAGLYEPLKRKAIHALLKKGQTFVDVGSNKGDYTLIGAKIVGDSGKVLSFEPEPSNVFWLNKSIDLNGYRNIILFDITLSDFNGTSTLFLSDQSDWHSLLNLEGVCNKGNTVIKVRTLDGILDETNQAKVDMIKIDVEGAELQVIKGAKETLLNNESIIILLDVHPQRGINPFEVADSLTELGFNLYQMAPPYNLPLKVDGETRELIACRHSL